MNSLLKEPLLHFLLLGAAIFGAYPLTSRSRESPPQVQAGRAVINEAPTVQREGEDEEAVTTDSGGGTTDTGGGTNVAGGGTGAAGGDTGAVPTGTGKPAGNPSWTKVGPHTNTTYSVSGSLRTVANAVAARTEAGYVKVTPGWTPQTWTSEEGTEEVISAQVTVAQEMELPTWSDKSKATANQQKEWDRFAAAVKVHEDGHVAKDKTAFNNVHTSMVGKRTEKEADEILDKVIAKAKTDNTDYDTATKSGITQGTGINPNIDEVTKVP